MMRLALLSSLLLATTTAKNTHNNGGGGGGGNPNNNGNKNKLGGFTTFAEAGSNPTSGSVGQCTITTTAGKTCTEGIAHSFLLTDVFGTTITYECDCPTTCSDFGTNAGVGAYKCVVTSDNYSDGICGDVDIVSSIFTSIGCEMDTDDGTMRCEADCYCDAAAHICTSEGEECCAGSCQKVSGAGVKGRWELQCMEEVSEEEVAKKNVKEGGAANDEWEEAA
jgi:hypothetical protein